MSPHRPLRRLVSFGFALFAALQALPAASASSPQVATQFDFSSDTTPIARKFYFATVPGDRYTLWRSTDLQTWAGVSGYPQPAAGLAMEHTFSQQEKEFFRVEPIDDQAPTIVNQFPGVDSYAVWRFDDLRFLLSDATGIDPASIRLTVGNGAMLSVGAVGLTFTGDVLTYDSGDAALGTHGATVPVTLIIADTLGHSVTHTFSFTLEVLPKVVPNLFVFGSPAAQLAGQQLPITPTAALAGPTGLVRMDGTDPWQISSILADRVVIAYTGATAPVFESGIYLANLTPVKLSDIFYRKVLSMSDAPAAKQLTLMTADVPFAEIVEEGTSSISANSVVYGLGEDGTIQPAEEVGSSMTLPRMGLALDDEGPLTLLGNPKFGVSLHKANAWITPTLECAVETKGFAVQRAAIQVQQDFEGTLIPELSYRPAGTEKEKEWNVHAPMKKLVMVGFIGAVPVWMDYTYTTQIKLDAEANAAAMLRFGWTRNASLSAGASYVKEASPRVSWSRNATLSPLTVEPLSLSLGGTVQAKVSLVPQLEVRVESLLGFYMNADPRAELEITADGGIDVAGQDGKIQMSPGGHATLTGGFFADLHAGLSIIGVNQEDLPAMDPLRIYTDGWALEFPEPVTLAITLPAAPQAVSVALGGSLNLAGTATGGAGPISYQWLHNGILIPGEISRQLTIAKVTSGNAGVYTLRARAGTATVFSPAFTVMSYNPGTPLPGFALIPAGDFQMGDQSNPLVGSPNERPVHSVFVSAFYMGKYEVTTEAWDVVRAWGMANGRGYADLAAGNGGFASKGGNHPVHSITWYDMVKWCNARSEKENLTPCYTVSGATFKTGQLPAVVCNWNANGYRLPTEAEWEKAARGGLAGLNFPWGNLINHSFANYKNLSYPYESPQNQGYHPIYAVGGHPFSSPVGSFLPNGYAVYDMAGSMWEWCWDGYGTYAAGSQTDPRGASSVAYRMLRGGGWYNDAGSCRVADRSSAYPIESSGYIGFRTARSLVP